MAKLEKKRLDYSASTYSGADISVIATLNFPKGWKPKKEELSFLDSLSSVGGEVIKVLKRIADPTDGGKRTFTHMSPQVTSNALIGTEVREQVEGFAFELGTVQTISYQTHRPKAPVRALGSTYAKGYTRGPRTIAGSMIFTVINEHPLRRLCKQMEDSLQSIDSKDVFSSILSDQLLPLDLTLLFANEYGSVSRMALYGVEFLNNGQTLSIEDLLLEEVTQFVALDIDPMTDITDTAKRGGGTKRSLSASEVFKADFPSYNEWLERVGMRRKF
ncbi:MAG: hypothetical protein CMB80_04405 [Flammeovirgaceae bacterium]|nr:hypothetical protein [Flammeovirgaceae bacterium]